MSGQGDPQARGCLTGAAAAVGALGALPLMVTATATADGNAPAPGIIISLVLAAAALLAFRSTSWGLRACALGLLGGWALGTILTAGSCTGFQEFDLYGWSGR